MDQIKIKVYKEDNMEPFGAYLSPSIKKDQHGIILFNVEAALEVSQVKENDISFKEVFISTIMHEVGHALEEFYNLEFNEERIEKICESYAAKYFNLPE